MVVVYRRRRRPFLPACGSRRLLSSAVSSAHWSLASKAQLRLRGCGRRPEHAQNAHELRVPSLSAVGAKYREAIGSAQPGSARS